MKQLYTKIISLCFFIFLFGNIAAQDCSSFKITFTSVNSTCQANGIITVALTGDVSNLINIQYSLTNAAGATVVNPQNSNVMPNLPKGNYTINVLALCGSTPITKSLPAVVVGNYIVPSTALNPTASRKSYAGCSTGIIALDVKNGSGNFTFTITSAPAGVATGPITPTKGSGYLYTLPGENYPAGEYSIQIEDGCYTSVATFALGEVTGFPAFQYTNGTGVRPVWDNSCTTLYWYARDVQSDNADYLRYYKDGMYEIGVAPAGSVPTSWVSWVKANLVVNNIVLDIAPHSYSDFYAPNKMSLYTRLKGCPTLYTSFDLSINNPMLSSSVQSYGCLDYDLQLTIYDNYYSLFCLPLNVVISKTVDGSVVSNMQFSNYPADAISTRLLYGTEYTITSTDASGYVFSNKMNMTRPIIYFTSNLVACDSWQLQYYITTRNDCWPIEISIKDPLGVEVCNQTMTTAAAIVKSCPLEYNKEYTFTATFPDGYQYTIKKSLASNLPTAFGLTVNYSETCSIDAGWFRIAPTSGIWPVGSVVTISGPEGFTTQTLTTSSNNYLNTTRGVHPPGDYRISVDYGCGTPVVSVVTMKGMYNAKDFAYTTEETCDGLKITPTGDITYQQAPVATTYYRLSQGPSGYDKTVITKGGSIYLTSPGTYKIATLVTNSASNCVLKALEIVYDKGPLALDDTGTTAYECLDSSTGVILLKGKNGIKPYTYQLWDATNTTKLVPDQVSEDQVHFNYGVAGVKYTARIIDACGNSFSQELSMANLADVTIAYASPANICIGETLQLRCASLGNTTYRWTGPNGFTSTEQNPTIPNAQVNMSGDYTVSVTPEFCGSGITSTVTVTVYGALKTGDIKGNQSVCVRTVPAALSCDVTGGTGVYTYQWETSADGVTGWTNIAGIAGRRVTYTPPTQLQEKNSYFRVTTTDKCGTVTSDVITVKYMPCYLPINPHIRSKAGK